FARNAIIHAEGQIDLGDFRDLPKETKGVVERFLNTPRNGGGPIVLPDANPVGDVLVLLAEFSYLIYRLVSEQCGMEINIEPSLPREPPQVDGSASSPGTGQ